MRLAFRIKLFLASATLVLLGLAVGDHFLSAYVRDLTLEQARRDLAERLPLVALTLPTGRPPSEAECRHLAAQASGGEGTTARVILAPARPGPGSGASPPGSEAEAGPREAAELAAAFAGAPASVRIDLAPFEPVLNAALPLRADGRIIGAVHISRPVPEVEAAIIGAQRLLGRGLVVALLLVALVTYGGPLLVSREVRDLTRTAGRMSEGDLSVRVQPQPDDPYAPLGRALDRLAENLSRTVTELRDERDLLGNILEGMEEGVLVLDDDRRVVLLNRALSTMLLLGPNQESRTVGTGEIAPSPLDVEGRSLLELAMNPDLEAVVDQCIAQPPRATGEIDVGDLKPRKLLVRATRLSGAPWGFLLVFVDVTEVRRLESLRRDFVANVSHELRTPVATVRSAAETLRSALQRDPSATERFLAIIERNAERLQVLVEDLLDLSRIESRAYRLNIEPIDVSKFVTDVLGLFRERADGRRLRLSAEVPADLPPLPTDRRALEQVLVNLVDNAVKYIPEEASITVKGRRDGALLRLGVSDTGPGIDSLHLPRLFERFYRVDPGRSRDRGGSGLGLAIVKHLVEAMGGSVSVESAIGRGTTFWVSLPLEKGAGVRAALS